MDAAQRDELAVIKRLDTDGDPGGTSCARSLDHVVAQRFGIRLERELIGSHGIMNTGDERTELVCPQHGGCPAADVGRTAKGKKPSPLSLVHHARQRPGIGSHEGVIMSRCGAGEVAVGAAPQAEGHVQVECLRDRFFPSDHGRRSPAATARSSSATSSASPR